jgi:hypothetical protein
MKAYLNAVRSERDIQIGLLICLFALLASMQSYLGLTRPAQMIEAYGIEDIATEGEMIVTSSGGLLLGISTIGTTIYWLNYESRFDSKYYFLISLYSIVGLFGAVILPYVLTGLVAIPLFLVHYSWGDLWETILTYRRKIRGESRQEQDD